ncbi:uncharacterized protein LOC142591107 [Dermacentor variabilis]|uniref:uncharacterized protein LOC142591107 n=1 Tax=Dermacentor variabilis TaxID=34621 RepID=UPI003F5C9284
MQISKQHVMAPTRPKILVRMHMNTEGDAYAVMQARKIPARMLAGHGAVNTTMTLLRDARASAPQDTVEIGAGYVNRVASAILAHTEEERFQRENSYFLTNFVKGPHAINAAPILTDAPIKSQTPLEAANTFVKKVYIRYAVIGCVHVRGS